MNLRRLAVSIAESAGWLSFVRDDVIYAYLRETETAIAGTVHPAALPSKHLDKLRLLSFNQAPLEDVYQAKFCQARCTIPPSKHLDFYSFDSDYLQRLQERDPATKIHFVSYFGKRLRTKLQSLGFDHAALEDVSHETFLRVLTAVRNGTVLHPERFGAYFNSVCDNVILEKYREDMVNQYLGVDAIEAPGGKTNLEAMVLRNEKRKVVVEILAELPPKKRNILRAMIFEHLDRDELCTRFNVKSNSLPALVRELEAQILTHHPLAW